MSLTPANLKLVYEAACSAVYNLRQWPDHSKDRAGGYLVIIDKISGILQSLILVGQCEDKEARKYQSFAIEKAVRLHLHTKHQSSYQSRDEGREKYQGAIKAPNTNLIFSFSGFSESEDEVIALMAAIHLGSIEIDEAKEIAKLSGNALFVQYLVGYGPK